ncbi:class IV adenylate cyclase [Micromonospora endolithica]|uniref:CYTH domain-containing protein n=1 Tax=Micromonospora endolithica TaxID=230091 RepID=A0A3A9ZQJ3_9ACTN|nr:CYTH domain-containing protein [Micromonospora endolithica]RKN50441.1 CYTH domain-containing protein [Micromonospora endolithica]TWJ20873.1 adenylate cyclase class 2 [Micromonospora endolithica]
MTHEPADNDHEVEAKYRVDDLQELITALARRQVVLTEPSVQDDQAYAPANWSYGMSKVGVPFARLRTQEGRHLFTVKKPIDNEMACLEHECVIFDRDAMHAALDTMGWVPTVRIVKRRRTGDWDGATVCVDVVDGLGVFVEVERVVSSRHSGEQVQHGLDAMIRSLGVPVLRVVDTYDTLIWNLARAAVGTSTPV